MKANPNAQPLQSESRRVGVGQRPQGLTMERLPGPFGARVSGIDLRDPWSVATVDSIRAAFLAHRVLVIRDQQLTKPRMGEFARCFGELEGNVFRKPDGSTMDPIHEISNVDAAGRPAESPYLKSNYHWHTDKAYMPEPALLTMLHAVELPRSGGDTQFADMTAAYDALPGDAKQRIKGLRVVHSLEYMRRSTDDRPPTREEREAAPPVTHPLVRTHADTARKSLFLGMYCSHVVDMDPAESRALLDGLLAHATQPRFVYTHRWQPGDVVLWDNRCLLHRAVANYDMAASRRVLHRLVVKGTVAA